MALSGDLISQLVKVNKEPKKSSESTVQGTTVIYEGRTYVKLDGSDLLTPVTTTSSAKDGDRVNVLMKDHTATITGNISDPSASSDTVKEQIDQISEFEIILSHTVSTEDLTAINASIDNLRAKVGKFDNMEAVDAEIENLEAEFINVDHLTAKDIDVINAKIDNLEVEFGKFTNISTEDLEAINAEIGNLKAYTADFTYVSTDVLKAIKADIKTLDTEKLSAESAEMKYANIDFANIGEAAFKKIFSESGLIKDLVVGDSTITGELVGVTIKGDIIEGGTVKADKLVVQGSDGIYYKLNIEAGTIKDGEPIPDDSLHGSIITAKSITAEKVSVKDLVAFGATIGGFTIKDHSLYSGVKSSADNNTRGIFLGDDGQIAFGDSRNFLRYYRDKDTGIYKLEISAGSLVLSSSGKTVEETIEDATDIHIGARNLIRNSTNMIYQDYYFNDISDDDVGTAVVGKAIVGMAIVGKDD